MLRWFLIAGLAGYGAWVSYLYVQQGPNISRLESLSHSLDTRLQVCMNQMCPKVHCECHKGETPTEVPDGDEGGSMNMKPPHCPDGLFPHCPEMLMSNPPSCKWSCVPRCTIRGYVNPDCAP